VNRSRGRGFAGGRSSRRRPLVAVASLIVALLAVTIGVVTPALAAGGSWRVVPSNSVSGPTSRLLAVSCWSSTACLAVGTSNDATSTPPALVEIRSGSTWRVAKSFPGSVLVVAGLSCPTSTFCAALVEPTGGGAWTSETWNGSAWTAHALPAGVTYTGLSCASSTFCLAVGQQSFTPVSVRWNGASWAAQDLNLPAGSNGWYPVGISCPSTNLCVTVAQVRLLRVPGQPSISARAAQWNGTGWAWSAALPGSFGSQLTDVSCGSSSHCEAVGTRGAGGLIESWNGTKWTPRSGVPPVRHVSCGEDSCVATSAHDYYSADLNYSLVGGQGTWQRHDVGLPAGAKSGQLNALSCARTGGCVAVGMLLQGGPSESVWVEHWNGSVWQPQAGKSITTPWETALNAVSCPTSTGCTALGSANNGLLTGLITGGDTASGWVNTSLTSTVSNYADVSCVTGGTCVAVGETISAATQDIRPTAALRTASVWSPVAVPAPTSAGLASVSCPSASFCAAVGDTMAPAGSDLFAESWNGKAWSVEATPAPTGLTNGALTSVVCPTSLTCFAVGRGDTADGSTTFAEQRTNGVWAPATLSLDVPDAVTCRSATNCVATGSIVVNDVLQREVASWNGQVWTGRTLSSQPDLAGLRIERLACAADRCFALAQPIDRFQPLMLLSLLSNAKTWTTPTLPAPAPGAVENLSDVSCAPPGGCTAVGSYYTPTGGEMKSLVLRFS
jgi:hypothetical protein